jgi:hypothetical protein
MSTTVAVALVYATRGRVGLGVDELLARSNDQPAAKATNDGRLIFSDGHGRQITAADLAHVTGTVNWQLVGNDHVSDEAIRLHDQAAAAGSRAHYDEALALHEPARRSARVRPPPVQDDIFNLLFDQQDELTVEENYTFRQHRADRGRRDGGPSPISRTMDPAACRPTNPSLRTRTSITPPR